jgi:hypothetical protein
MNKYLLLTFKFYIMKKLVLLILTFVTIGLNAQMDLSQNLVFYYQLEDNANDASLKGNNGVTKSITYTDGKFNKGAEFNAIDSYVQSPAALLDPAASDLTVAAWVYIRSFEDKRDVPVAGNRQKMVCQMQDGTGKGRSFLYVNPIIDPNGNVLQSFLGGSTVTGNTYITANEWAHLALVVTTAESKATLYYNGKVIADSVTKNPIEACNGEYNFGVHKINADGSLNLPDRVFDGFMDEIALLNKALTLEEINSLMTHGAIHGSASKDLSGKSNLVKIVSVSGGILNIRTTEDFTLDNAKLTIYDLGGRMVLSKEINSGYSNIQTGLNSGNYVLLLESNQNKYRTNIIIR